MRADALANMPRASVRCDASLPMKRLALFGQTHVLTHHFRGFKTDAGFRLAPNPSILNLVQVAAYIQARSILWMHLQQQQGTTWWGVTSG